MTSRRSVWLAVTLGLAALTAVNLVMCLQYESRGGVFSDFRPYWAGAQVGVSAGWGHVYDTALEWAAGERAWGTPYRIPLLTPPPILWLMLPLVSLPARVAYWIWSALLLLSVGLAGCLVTSGWRARLTALGVAFGLLTLAAAIMSGQAIAVLVLAVVLSWRMAKAGHDIRAGILLSVVALKPQVAFLLPVALLAAGRPRICVACAVSVGVIAAASIATVGLGGAEQYIHLLRSATTLPMGNYSLTRALTGIPARVLAGVCVTTLVLVASYRRQSLETAFSAGLIGSMLLAPYLNQVDQALVVVPVWLLWRSPVSMASWCAAAWWLAVEVGAQPTILLFLEGTLLISLVMPHGRSLSTLASLRNQWPWRHDWLWR